MEAQKVGSDTVLAQIIRMVGDAQRSRAPIQKLADTFAGYFVPTVIIVAAGTFVTWSLVGAEPRVAHGIVNAIAVLIIACPCALGLATSMSIRVATGKAASLGILFKNADALEEMRKVDTLVIDKTGTLTEGKPKLVDVVTIDGASEDSVLMHAASLERGSEHPLAAAVVAGAIARGIEMADVTDFGSITGEGL